MNPKRICHSFFAPVSHGSVFFFSLSIISVFLFLLILPWGSNATGQTADTWIQKLDRNYYYPQNLGLNKLTVDIQWETSSSDTDSTGRNPEVQFRWEKGNRLDRREFTIKKNDGSISDQRARDIVQLFQNYQEVVLPHTLNQNFMGFHLVGKKETKNGIYMRFEPSTANHPNRRIDLRIDPEKSHIKTFKISRNGPPHQVTSHMQYLKKGNQWLVAETLSQFEMNKQSYQETISIFYHPVEGFWLPKKAVHRLTLKGDLLNSHTFRFYNYQLN